MPNLNNALPLIQNSKNTLFILCGFPYAGKSFVARQLEAETDVVFVSIDAIFHTYGFDWNTNNLPDIETWEQIFNESYKQIKQALTDGRNVLYDSTNQSVVSRDKLRQVANSVGANSRVIYVQSSVENVWKRWEENHKSLNRSVVSKELVQQTIDMFEEPTDDENTLVIHN